MSGIGTDRGRGPAIGKKPPTGKNTYESKAEAPSPPNNSSELGQNSDSEAEDYNSKPHVAPPPGRKLYDPEPDEQVSSKSPEPNKSPGAGETSNSDQVKSEKKPVNNQSGTTSGASEVNKTSNDQLYPAFYFQNFQVIGDAIAFSLSKALSIPMRIRDDGQPSRHYYSAFEFITVDYLSTHVAKLDSVTPNVLLATGFSDQILEHRQNIDHFRQSFSNLLTTLIKKGAKVVILVIPPPHPRISSSVGFQFYQSLRRVIVNATPCENLHVELLDCDDLFFKKCDKNYGLTKTENNIETTNIELFRNAFAMGNGNKIYVSQQTARQLLDKIKVTVSHLKRRRIVPMSCVARFKDDFVESGSSEVKPNELRFFGSCLRISLWLGNYKLSALCDSGAGASVMSSRLFDLLSKNFPQWIWVSRLPRPVILNIAVGRTESEDRVVALKFSVSENVLLYTFCLVVEGLSDDLIIGCNFFRQYEASISFRTMSIELFLPNRHLIELPGIAESNHCPIRTENLSFATLDLDVAKFLATPIENLNALTDRYQTFRAQIREKALYALQHEVITDAQMELALEKLMPLCEIFDAESGTYRWEKVHFNIRATEMWKPKKYGYPICYQDGVRWNVRQMVKEGTIRVSDTQWIHPIVIVPKKSGEIRICIDGSALNKILTPQHHESRNIETILFEESKGSMFSTFDFSQGFLQIQLDPESAKFLGFQVDGTTYEYAKLPFGTAVSSSVFNRIVRQVVYEGVPPKDVTISPEDHSTVKDWLEIASQDRVEVDEKLVRCYVDDLLLMTVDFDTHLNQMVQVFKNILSSGMRLSLPKTVLFAKSVTFLGHVLEPGQVAKCLNKKVFFENFEKSFMKEGKLKFPSKKSVQRLVGFLNWFSRFLPSFADDIEPFLELIRSPTPYTTTERHMRAYNSLKENFMKDFKLHQPLFGQPIYLHFVCADAWVTGCIFQRSDTGEPLVITMFSSRFPVSVLIKVPELKQYYSLYFVLKRYKDLLYNQKIVVNRTFSGIVQNLGRLLMLTTSLLSGSCTLTLST